jgi:hypothetical protein
MSASNRNASLMIALAVAAAAFALPAVASLGGDEATVAADHAVLEGKMKVSRVPRYAVHEIAAPSGTVVREFVSLAGKVFAVSWSGPTLPDLQAGARPVLRHVRRRAPAAQGARTGEHRAAGTGRAIERTHASVRREGISA